MHWLGQANARSRVNSRKHEGQQTMNRVRVLVVLEGSRRALALTGKQVRWRRAAGSPGLTSSNTPH